MSDPGAAQSTSTNAAAAQSKWIAQFAAWCGVAAPLLYVLTVIAGGASVPGYSQIGDPISSLTQAGRSGVDAIASAFTLYNLLVAVFAISGLAGARHSRRWSVIFGLLLFTSLCGLLMGPFAQDPIGSPVTLKGGIHIALAAATSLATVVIIAMSFLAVIGRRHPILMPIIGVCLSLTLPFGLVTAIAVPNSWPTMGLFERLTIGGFELWILAVAWTVAGARTRLFQH